MFKTFSPQGLLKIYSVMVCIFNFWSTENQK
jgi:hypothetical protein